MDSQATNTPSSRPQSCHNSTSDSFLDLAATLSSKTPEQIAANERFWDGFDDDVAPSQSATVAADDPSRHSFEIPRTESPLRAHSLLSRISSLSSDSDHSTRESTNSTEKKRPPQPRKARKDADGKSNASAAADDDVEMRVLRNRRWFGALCYCHCWAGAH